MGSWNVVGELVIGYVAEWTHTPFVQVSTAANPSVLQILLWPFRRWRERSPHPSSSTRAAERTKDGPQHARPAAALYKKGRVFSHLAFCVYVCACAAAGRQPDHDADGLRLRGAGHPPEESLKRPAHVRAHPSAHQPRYVTRDILLPGAFAAASGIISAASRVHMS
jgi:hypothetical protein